LAAEFREPLPDRCPPATAVEVCSVITVYRLLESTTPQESDFDSHQARQPEKKYSEKVLCKARGLSVYDKTEQAMAARRLPTLKHKNLIVCRVTLCQGAGYIIPPDGNGHRTWWPLRDFKILDRCEVLS